MQLQPSLSNLQQELLKLYARDVSETDLLAIKKYLATFFAEKALNEADAIWDEKGYNNQTMQQWLNEDNEKYGQ